MSCVIRVLPWDIYSIVKTTVSYSTCISACSKGQHWERALQLLEEMRRQRTEPNVVSYNAAISAFSGSAAQRDWEPDFVSYNAAISACA